MDGATSISGPAVTRWLTACEPALEPTVDARRPSDHDILILAELSGVGSRTVIASSESFETGTGPEALARAFPAAHLERLRDLKSHWTPPGCSGAASASTRPEPVVRWRCRAVAGPTAPDRRLLKRSGQRPRSTAAILGGDVPHEAL